MKGFVIDEALLIMTDRDTVATALEDLTPAQGFSVDGCTISLNEEIPFGHKVALESMEVGDDVVKYGEVIGTTTTAITPGDWVHTHNCESVRGRGDKQPSGGGS
jgi:altronate dehydratase small subunit